MAFFNNFSFLPILFNRRKHKIELTSERIDPSLRSLVEISTKEEIKLPIEQEDSEINKFPIDFQLDWKFRVSPCLLNYIHIDIKEFQKIVNNNFIYKRVQNNRSRFSIRDGFSEITPFLLKAEELKLCDVGVKICEIYFNKKNNLELKGYMGIIYSDEEEKLGLDSRYWEHLKDIYFKVDSDEENNIIGKFIEEPDGIPTLSERYQEWLDKNK